jgi:two-component system, NtrC family, sensor kinase
MMPSHMTVAEEKLAELYRLASLGRLLACVAHEINTPVASILSNNDVMRRALEALRDVPLAAETARKIEALRTLADVDKAACERIKGLIRTVKRLARGKDAERGEADVNALLRECLTLVQYEFRSRIAVETDFGELPSVVCYPQLLSQVFLNLLINAGQAIEGEGRVVVGTLAEAGAVHIRISDTGRGIDPANRAKLFTPGFTTKPAGVGTGLGLAISKEAIEKHGGTIEFESRPGGGTTFHIRIPAGSSHGGQNPDSPDC